MILIRLIPCVLLLLSGICAGDLCTYDEETASEYVSCLSITQRPPYACESNGGSLPSEHQIHILETDLIKMQYDADNPPEVIVVIKPWSSFTELTQTIVLVFHAFKPVTWRVYSEHFPIGTKFIIKSSYPLLIDPSSVLAKTQVEILSTLPKDSVSVIRMIESYFGGQRITSFSGFHEGSRINWAVGHRQEDNDNACTIQPLSLTKRIHIFKEVPVRTSGCAVPAGLGFNTHIIDIGSTTDSQFPLAKHFATLIVKSKIHNEEFYGSNVVLILKSKKTIEWTIDTSGMDGNVLVVTNGKSQTPIQSNLNLNTVGMGGFPDLDTQGFINYVSKTYGVVASYTKAVMANHIIIEVPEVLIHSNAGNATEQPRTDPLPDVEEIIASVDGQKSVNCYKSTVTVSWPLQLLESLYVEDIYFTDDILEKDECGLQMVSSQGTLLSQYDECGFTATHSHYSSLYQATISVVLNDGRSSQIHVQCRIYNTSKIEVASNEAMYHLSIFEDAEYTTQLTEFNVPDNGYVYFQADLKEITDPNMSAIVEECFISPTRENILDRHVLITQTCPLDSSIHFLNQNYIGIRDEPSQKIKFRMSNYFVYSDNYFLHCKVSMCSKIVTPDIPMCSILYQTCKRDPPMSVTELPPGVEREYILAGPIYLHNTTTELDNENRGDEKVVLPCANDMDNSNRGLTNISLGLLIGIALGSFALGIILTVFTIHCVSVSKSRNKLPPTDVFRFENRPVADNMYEPLKLYDVCPQGHHLNRTTGPDPELSQPV